MTFLSYAQNREDVMLWRALKHIENGFYIDVGASDPEEDSVTKAFYDRGWHGINVEPLPAYHQRLCQERPRDINLAIAAAETDGELVLFDIPAVRGWASPDPALADDYRNNGFDVQELKVPARTLASICEQYVKGDIHFLKIDVECFETEVIHGMDFRKWRPWVLVVEATLPNSQISNHEAWEYMLTEHGYRYAYFDGLNRYYVAQEHAELARELATPPNVFDDFQTIVQAKALRAAQAAEARAQEAQARAQEAEAREQDVTRQMEAMKRSWSWRLTRPLRWVREARARQAEDKAEEAEAKARAAQLQAREADARAREAETKAQQLQAQVNALHGQLQDVYASTSWKISAPVRKAGRALIVGKGLARQAGASPRTMAQQSVRALVRRAVPLIRRSPYLTESAWRVLDRFPALRERILRYARPSAANGADRSARDILAVPDAPAAWTPSASPSGHFKNLLSRELQRRQTNEAR